MIPRKSRLTLDSDTGWIPQDGGHVRHVVALGSTYELQTTPPVPGQPATWRFTRPGLEPLEHTHGVLDSMRWDEVEAQEMCDLHLCWFVHEHDPVAVCRRCKGPKPPRWGVGAHYGGAHDECAACEAEAEAEEARWNALPPEERAAIRTRALAGIQARLAAKRATTP